MKKKIYMSNYESWLRKCLKRVTDKQGNSPPPDIFPKTNTKTEMPKCKPAKKSIVELWIVGKFLCVTDKGRAWDILGVYDSEELALKNCPLGKSCFIAPVILNDPSFLKQKEWKGAYYPKSPTS